MPINPRLVQLQNISFDDLDFCITVAEINKQIPYAVERIYWLRAHSLGVARGNHAHINSHQFIISIQGNIDVQITNKDSEKTNFELKSDGVGLYIPPKHWLNIQMPTHAVLLCLSSHVFEEQITVYDYHEFIASE